MKAQIMKTITATVAIVFILQGILFGDTDYVPNRILVKLTDEAINDPEFFVQRDPLSTGLPSLDSLNQTNNITNILPVYIGNMKLEGKQQYGLLNWFIFDYNDSMDVETKIEQYNQNEWIFTSTPDYYLIPADIPPNDPYYSENWGYNNDGDFPSEPAGNPVGAIGFDTDIVAAWETLNTIDESITFGDPNITIAIIDTGIDYDHPDLTGNIWNRPDGLGPYQLSDYWSEYSGIDEIDDIFGLDLEDFDGIPEEFCNGQNQCTNHGTLCAGIAAGDTDNDIGISGVAGGCKILMIKKNNLYTNNYNHNITMSSYATGILYAVDREADIISISYGYSPGYGGINDDTYNVFNDAVNYAWEEEGLIIFAATHNYDYNYITWPANLENVIAVGAAAPCGTRKNGDRYGAEISCDGSGTGQPLPGNGWTWGSDWTEYPIGVGDNVDFLAPNLIPSTDNNGGYDISYGGTSCATPFAAGVAALIKSVNPFLTNVEIRAIMQYTATDVIDDAHIGEGMPWAGMSMEGWDMFTGYGMVNAGAAVQMAVDEPEFVRLYNQNQMGENIGGTLKLEDINQGNEYIVLSGSLAPVRFGDPYNVETLLLDHPDYTHIDWNQDRSEFRVRREAFVMLNLDIIAYFSSQNPLDISANYEGISITIRDPWYINQYGAQTDSYYPVEDNLEPDGYYHVFLDQGIYLPNPEPPFYSLSAPEVVLNSPTEAYVFNTWTGNYCNIESPANNETAIIARDDNNLSTVVANYTIVIDDPAGASPAPGNLTIDVSSGNPVLNWDHVNDSDRSHYNIFARYQALLGGQSVDWHVTCTSKNNTWTDTNVITGGQVYEKIYYKVTVVDYFNNESGYSNTVQCRGDVIYYPARETDISENIPRAFNLHPAYPNPFNPVTTIRYDLPVNSHVTLTVYDIRGGEVATLINGMVSAGYHTIRWDGRDFRSGIYFIRFITPAYIKTEKVILLK